jgi:cytochrome c-type biogenesis protein
MDDAYVFLYDSQLTVSAAIENQLSAPSPATLAALYCTGLLSAFSPCEISLLPLTLAYLGGAVEEGDRRT